MRLFWRRTITVMQVVIVGAGVFFVTILVAIVVDLIRRAR
jgi:hypothetical protein